MTDSRGAYSLGVDLGTTFLTAAVARPTGVRMVPLGERSVAAPAVVHVGDDGAATTGDVAERRALARPEGAVRELKRRLGGGRAVRLGAASYPVPALLGAQLRHVLRRVSAAEGGAPERVVLTRAASWDDVRRARFDDVWRAAGLAAPLIVTEPEAAVCGVPDDTVRDGETVAVYDLGGGGVHATVVRRRGDRVDVLGTPEGDERLGGVELDGAVLDHVADVAGNGARIEIDGDDPWTVATLARLRQDCILAKEALSSDVEAVVPVILSGGPVEVRLTRATIEEMLRGPLESTMRAVARTIRSAGLIPSDLGAVLLMGGSSRIPLVTEMLAQQFGRPLRSVAEPKNAVALGAARLGATRLGSAPQPATIRGRAAPARAAVGGPVRPVEALLAAGAGGGLLGTGGPSGPPTPDVPLPVVQLPRPEPGTDADEPDRRWVRTWLPLAAAAVAVLVLVGVFVLTPSGVPDAAPVPLGTPVSASAPPAAPSGTTAVTTTPAPPRTSSPRSTRTSTRPSTRPAPRTSPRASTPAPRTTTPTTTAKPTKKSSRSGKATKTAH